LILPLSTKRPVITLDIPLAAMPGYERDQLSAIWSDVAGRQKLALY